MNIKKIIFIFFLLVISLYFFNTYKFVNYEINPNLPLSSIPVNIPSKYKWDLLNLNNKKDLDEAYIFLKDNYLESGTYNIEYSKDLLKNTLGDYTSIVLRKRSNNKIIGFISRIMRKVNMYDKIIDMFEIDFLSIDKKERNKYIAPLLINEMERLCNYENKWARALFIISKKVPKYNLINNFPGYIRPINIKKLRRARMVGYNYEYGLNNYKSKIKVEELKEKDIPQCTYLLNKYCKQNYDIFYIYDNKSFKKQYFDPKDCKSYVVKDINGNITDFFSYFISIYKSPSEINLRYGTLNSYFNFNNNLNDLITESVIMAKKDNCDYLIASGFGNYKKFINYCRFYKIYDSANLYTFNWKVSQTDKNKFFISFLG